MLRNAVRGADELAALLELPREALGGLPETEFPLLVPRGFVARMAKRDPNDPLLRQVLPRAEERLSVPGFSADPLREQAVASTGLLQKYRHRVLLIASGACPIHCRYCFRRSFPYSSQLAARADWAAAVDRLERTPDVSEVILSGGDPLSLSNRRLRLLLAKLESIPAVQTLRIHTRFPIAIPERVDERLETMLRGTRLRTVVVVHCNHPNELDAPVEAALSALKRSADHVLNQSVLLRGVNDDAATLASLSERLFACGVLPYYIHLLDPVAGTAHFDVPESEGRALLADLRSRLPGYLVPRLVKEAAGELSKTLIG